MTVTIENPWWLGAAACVAALLTLFWLLAKNRSPRWKLTCLTLPGAAALMAAFAVAGLALKWNPPAQQIVILLDLSPSTRISPWSGPGGATWLRNLAELRLGPSKEVTVIGFGGAAAPRLLLDHIKIGDAPHWPTQWQSAPEGIGSDIAPALTWRSPQEARPNAPLAPRWLITDGLITGTSPTPLPFELGWTAIPPTQPDVGVLELGVNPNNGSPPQGLNLWAQIRATEKTDATLSILRDGTKISQQPVSFADAGSRWITYHDPTADLSVGHRYEIQIARRPTPDPWPENDTGSVLWMPETQVPRVLIVGSPANSEILAGGPANHRGIIPPAQFPENVGQLLAQGWQVIVLNDVPLAPVDASTESSTGVLSKPAVQVLEQFVRDTGGGLLIVGRKNAFGPGHYAEADDPRLEALSPVWSQPHDRPAARIIFVLDASGSMNEPAPGPNAGGERKFRLVARGVEQALSLLKDQDRVTVLTFSDHAEQLAAGTKEQLTSGQNPLRYLLDSVLPTGNTLPDTALPPLAAALEKKDPDTAGGSTMVVLLTDGEIPAMDTAKWQSLLAANAAKLTIVAPPPAADTSLLKSLADSSHAAWLATDDAGQWAALLKRAVAQELMGRALTSPLPWKSLEANLSGETRQWIEVWPKHPDAQLLAVSQSTPPRTLAAEAQRGLGRVAAVAMADDSPAYAQLLHQIVKDIMPAPGDRRFTLWARREDGRAAWQIGADGVQSGKFLDGEHLQLHIYSGSLGDSEQILDLPQTAPGRYQTRLTQTTDFAATVLRQSPTGPALVGRISPGRTELGEWPASATPSPAPPQAQFISTSDVDHRQWPPRILGWQFPFTPALWLATSLAVLASLWARRAPIGARR